MTCQLIHPPRAPKRVLTLASVDPSLLLVVLQPHLPCQLACRLIPDLKFSARLLILAPRRPKRLDLLVDALDTFDKLLAGEGQGVQMLDLIGRTSLHGELL